MLQRSTWRFVAGLYLLTLAGCSRGVVLEPLDKADITFRSGPLKIHGLLSKPPGQGPFPLVLLCHGDGGSARSMAYFMNRYTTQGFATLAGDFRGCSPSEGSSEKCKGDVDDALNALKKEEISVSDER